MLFSTTKQAAFVACFVVLGACSNENQNETGQNEDIPAIVEHTASESRTSDYETRVLPEASTCIQSGDLVTRRGSDLTSFLMANMNPTDRSFSHCGIASIENDTILIYHAIGGEFNPDQKLKRETLYSFAHPVDNKALGIFKPNLDTASLKMVISYIKYQFIEGMPFDMEFDLNTDKRQYCSEFAAKSYGTVWDGLQWVSITQQAGRRFIPVDALFLNKQMIERKRWSY
jgi:hypothetical protein